MNRWLQLKTGAAAVFALVIFCVHVSGLITQNWWAILMPFPLAIALHVVYPFHKYAADVDRIYAPQPEVNQPRGTNE